MRFVFELLMLAAVLGAIDTFWFHIYKFRLYRQDSSVGEQITHLVRAAMFSLATAVIMFSDGGPAARTAVLVVFALDLVNSAIDVLLERRSRAPLGGLPSLEYLLHILVTLVLGGAIAAFYVQSSTAGFEAVTWTTTEWLRGVGAAVGGVVVLLIESSLFISARLRASAKAANTHTPATG